MTTVTVRIGAVATSEQKRCFVFLSRRLLSCAHTMLDLMTRLPVSLHDNIYDHFYYLQSLAPCAPFKVSTDMTIFNFPMLTLGCCPGFRQTGSHKLQTKCQATQALLHVISLIDWPSQLCAH